MLSLLPCCCCRRAVAVVVDLFSGGCNAQNPRIAVDVVAAICVAVVTAAVVAVAAGAGATMSV